MSKYSVEIIRIIDTIRDDMEALGEYAFQGFGDPKSLRDSFIRSYEAAITAKKLYDETFPDRPLNTSIGCLSKPDEEDTTIDTYYQELKREDFMPSPFFFMSLGEHTMTLNSLFIAVQQAGH